MADKENKTVETSQVQEERDSKSKETSSEIKDEKLKKFERTKKISESEKVSLGNSKSDKGSNKVEAKDVKESKASVSDVKGESKDKKGVDASISDVTNKTKSDSKISESNDKKSEVSNVGKIDTKLETSENSGTDKNNEDEIVEEVELLDLSNLKPERRNKLFQQGLDYEKASQTDSALKCYLSCLTGLRADTYFVLLPQCLRNIADIYFKKEEYEKAILFIQAEKLYYENALIDTTEIQNTLEKLRNDQSTPDTTEPINEDSVRADEYENLAKLCMDQKQPHLALEYAGKATKIRQQIYGNDHQTTKDSLDYFATLYAEVGRKQYTDSMHHLSSESDQDYKDDYQNISPTSILRQRRRKSLDTSYEKERKKTVRFGEPIETRILVYEENIPRSFTVLFFLFSFLVMLILGTWLFCVMRNDHVCRSFSSEIQYLYNKFRYFIYNYTGSKKFKN